jgi:hypothetical protein
MHIIVLKQPLLHQQAYIVPEMEVVDYYGMKTIQMEVAIEDCKSMINIKYHKTIIPLL